MFLGGQLFSLLFYIGFLMACFFVDPVGACRSYIVCCLIPVKCLLWSVRLVAIRGFRAHRVADDCLVFMILITRTYTERKMHSGRLIRLLLLTSIQFRLRYTFWFRTRHRLCRVRFMIPLVHMVPNTRYHIHFVFRTLRGLVSLPSLWFWSHDMLLFWFR